MALLELLRERCSFTPTIAAGHSLGEYSALCAAGVLNFDDALKLIQTRARGMDQAQPAGTCGMAALIGPTKDEALEIVESSRGDDVLEAANFNAPDQVVVSGHLSAIGRVIETAKERDRARGVKLPVSSAFHTCLMEPAKQTLSEELSVVALKSSEFSVVANVTGREYPSLAEAKNLLVEQVVNPVQWVDCVQTMVKNRTSLFVEVGPGKVLTGLLRRIERKTRAMSISDMYGISAFEGVMQ
jgi:[acyl-carrier-protein] S-malonyltransferase